MGNRLDAKVCIVTGAGQGIGRGCAIEMAKAGGKVVVSDYKTESGEETVRLIQAAGGEGIFVKCDVRRRDEIEALMKAAAEHFGGIDVLHNNAGTHETALSDKTSLLELSDELWEQVYEVNVRSMWYATRAAFPYLQRSKAAAIINAASLSSFIAFPASPAYCTSKGAVLMLTKAMAVDLAPHNIRVNCICPGTIDTQLLRHYFDIAPDKAALEAALLGGNLIKRLGTPEEVGKLVCFLASEDASFITGSAQLIDAGVTAWRG